MMRLLTGLAVLAAGLLLTGSAGGIAATTADSTLVLDGGAPTVTGGQCPGPITLQISGPATSSHYGFGSFTSTISIRFDAASGALMEYREAFRATFPGVVVDGTSDRDPAESYKSGCSPSLTVEGTMRSALSAPTARHRYTVVERLDVLNLPAASTVRTTCEGRCPFRSRTRRVDKGAARIRLQPLFGNAELRPGTVIEIRITAPQTIGKLFRYSIRRGKLPSARTLCLPPGGASPRPC
jgi:hypothetical protein